MMRSANGFQASGDGADDVPYAAHYTDNFGGSRSNFAHSSRKGSRRPSIVEGNGHAAGGVPVVAAERPAEQGVQKLLEHTARYIAEFDRPPRLLRSHRRRGPASLACAPSPLHASAAVSAAVSAAWAHQG